MQFGKGSQGNVQNKHKKLTNVSLYVCMSAENSNMIVFLCFYVFVSNFPIVAWEKNIKC